LNRVSAGSFVYTVHHNSLIIMCLIRVLSVLMVYLQCSKCSTKPAPQCKTKVLITLSTFNGLYSDSFILSQLLELDLKPLLIINSTGPPSSNLQKIVVVESVEAKWTLPRYLSSNRHTDQCQIVFVLACVLQIEDIMSELQFLTSNQLTRPHIDTFIFIQAQAAKTDVTGHVVNRIPHISFVHLDQFPDGAPIRPQIVGPREILNQKHFKITATSSLSFIRVGSRGEGSGPYFEVLREASLQYNFTFNLKLAEGGVSGNRKGGIWNGAVGEVLRGEADFSLGPGLTPERNFVVENGFPLEFTHRTFFTLVKQGQKTWRSLLYAFQPVVWTWLILGASTMAVVLYMGHTTTTVAKLPRQKPNSSPTFGEAFYTILAILLDQGVSLRFDKSMVCKALFLIWLLASLVLGGAYRSKLIYFLFSNEPPNIPRYHAELLDHNYVIFYRYYGGVAYKTATESRDAVNHGIIRRAILLNSSSECIIAAILTENSACLDWNSHGSLAVHSNATINAQKSKSLMVTSKDSLVTVTSGWIFPKSSPLVAPISSLIFRIFGSGIYTKWKEDDALTFKRNGASWIQEAQDVETNQKILEIYGGYEDSIHKPLSIKNLYGVFAFMLIAFVIASITFIFQLCPFSHWSKSIGHMAVVSCWFFFWGKNTRKLHVTKIQNRNGNQMETVRKREPDKAVYNCHLSTKSNTAKTLTVSINQEPKSTGVSTTLKLVKSANSGNTIKALLRPK